MSRSVEVLRIVAEGGLEGLRVGTQLVRDADRMQTYSVVQMDGWVALMGVEGAFNILEPPPWLFHMGPLGVVYEPEPTCVECGDGRGWRVEPDPATGEAMQVQCRTCAERVPAAQPTVDAVAGILADRMTAPRVTDVHLGMARDVLGLFPGRPESVVKAEAAADALEQAVRAISIGSALLFGAMHDSPEATLGCKTALNYVVDSLGDLANEWRADRIEAGR